jgi:hypothetical protein
LHSGYGSTVEPTIEQLWQNKVMADVEAMWNMAEDENRAGFVSFPAHAAFHRSGTMAITPSLTFGNAGNAKSGEDAYMNFSSNGKHIVGGAHAHYNRLAREIVYLHHNFAQHTGLQGMEDPRDMLKRIKYPDDRGNLVHCDPLPFHAVEDAQLLAYWRGRYKWHYMACEQHRIGVLKSNYKKNQAKIKHTPSIDPSELMKLKTRARIPQMSVRSSQDIPDSPLTEYDYSSWPSGSSSLAAPPNQPPEQSEDIHMAHSEPSSTKDVDPSPQSQSPDTSPSALLSQTSQDADGENRALTSASDADPPPASSRPQTDPLTVQADRLLPTSCHGAQSTSIEVVQEPPVLDHLTNSTAPSPISSAPSGVLSASPQASSEVCM